MTSEQKPSLIQTPETPAVIASHAKDINFVDVAKRTGGVLTWQNGEPHIGWNDNKISLEWRPDCEGQSKGLFFWRGDWGGGGLERKGLVLGEDYIAFVYPEETKTGELQGEIITKNGTDYIKGPAGMFNHAFITARDLALQALQDNPQK